MIYIDKDHKVKECEPFNINRAFIIVVGEMGIGKTTYIEAMKKHSSYMQYVEVQNLYDVDRRTLLKANHIIEIREIFLDEVKE